MTQQLLSDLIVHCYDDYIQLIGEAAQSWLFRPFKEVITQTTC